MSSPQSRARASLTASTHELPRIVGGRFEVHGRLGVGGEAEVFRARDLELDLDVVLKTRLVADGDDLSRLRRKQARSCAPLRTRGFRPCGAISSTAIATT